MMNKIKLSCKQLRAALGLQLELQLLKMIKRTSKSNIYHLYFNSDDSLFEKITKRSVGQVGWEIVSSV